MESEYLVFIYRLCHSNWITCIGLLSGNKVFVYLARNLLKFHPAGSKSFSKMFFLFRIKNNPQGINARETSKQKIIFSNRLIFS